MSRLLYRLSYTAVTGGPARVGEEPFTRAPIRNRTVDLLLTMETLCRLSYWGQAARKGYTTARGPPNPLSCRAPGDPDLSVA